jgi:hypothetical protein
MNGSLLTPEQREWLKRSMQWSNVMYGTKIEISKKAERKERFAEVRAELSKLRKLGIPTNHGMLFDRGYALGILDALSYGKKSRI